jgi:hypothetical protein
MKIKPDHFEYMKAAILANSHAPTLPSYLTRGLTEKRWRWDLLYAAKLSPWICANIYPYANDEHIDTALRVITRDPTLQGEETGK